MLGDCYKGRKIKDLLDIFFTCVSDVSPFTQKNPHYDHLMYSSEKLFKINEKKLDTRSVFLNFLSHILIFQLLGVVI